MDSLIAKRVMMKRLVSYCILYALQTGKHLMTCEDFKCPDKYYKCPQYYCVRYKFLCDERWDCPGGHDESKMLCTDRKCQGQFKCHNSTVLKNITNVPNTIV